MWVQGFCCGLHAVRTQAPAPCTPARPHPCPVPRPSRQMPSGAAFLGSTPECLYTRTGSAVASEAVAGTRARGAGGDVEKDFWLAFDLLRSHKDHVEFSVVRDWVQQVGRRASRASRASGRSRGRVRLRTQMVGPTPARS